MAPYPCLIHFSGTYLPSVSQPRGVLEGACSQGSRLCAHCFRDLGDGRIWFETPQVWNIHPKEMKKHSRSGISSPLPHFFSSYSSLPPSFSLSLPVFLSFAFFLESQFTTITCFLLLKSMLYENRVVFFLVPRTVPGRSRKSMVMCQSNNEIEKASFCYKD